MFDGRLRGRVCTGVGLLALLGGFGIAAVAPVDHLRGSVTAVDTHTYQMRDDSGTSVRVAMAPAGHLYRLVPVSISAARDGWGAHAIGRVRRQTILTSMLVLFPPESAAGVPPASAGMSGVGKLVKHGGRLGVRTPGGEKTIVLAAAARIVMARSARLSSLHTGDMAMAFGRRTSSGFVASIVHIPPRIPGMGPMGARRGMMSRGKSHGRLRRMSERRSP